MHNLLVDPETPIYEQPTTHDLRLKHIIHPWHGQNADIALVGVPWDEAISAGGGRPGAAKGPDSFRNALKRFGTTYFLDQDKDIADIEIVDCGDIAVVPGDVHETHDRISAVVQFLVEKNILPVVIGGGHDISYATIRGLAHATGQVGGINIDAHFDVRPVVDGVISSGTPFWRALEENHLDGARFVELGMPANSNAQAHRDYLLHKRASIISLHQFRSQPFDHCIDHCFEKIGQQAFLSIDIDVVQQAFAPGCSAPAPIGMTPDEIANLAFIFGKNPAIQLFDLMELCPQFDHGGLTARLVASIFSSFLLGYSLRTYSYDSLSLSSDVQQRKTA